MEVFSIFCMHAFFILCMHAFSKFCMRALFILCMNAFFTCLTFSIHLMHACICVPLFWQMWPHVPWGMVDVIISVRWVLRFASTAAAEQDGSSAQTKETASVKHTKKTTSIDCLIYFSIPHTGNSFYICDPHELPKSEKNSFVWLYFNWLSAKEMF